MNEAEIIFLRSLLEATEKKRITWSMIPDDDREQFQAIVDGDIVEIELVYFEVATGGVYEIIIAIISGMKVYIRAAVGTPAYDIVSEMLSISIEAWDQEGGMKRLTKATARIKKLLEDA